MKANVYYRIPGQQGPRVPRKVREEVRLLIRLALHVLKVAKLADVKTLHPKPRKQGEPPSIAYEHTIRRPRFILRHHIEEFRSASVLEVWEWQINPQLLCLQALIQGGRATVNVMEKALPDIQEWVYSLSPLDTIAFSSREQVE